MGIFDKIRGEFIDIIEWLDDSQDTIVYRFEREDNEIKNGAKLTVRESQVAVFVNEGQIADVFPPGMYTLTTENLPILSTLKGWKYGFNSPFKAEVYFVNTKRFVDLKWGTANPIMMRDADFGLVRVRAFGTYAMRVSDASRFLKEIVGTDWHFTVDEVSEHVRNQIVSKFTEGIATAQIPVIELATKYGRLGEQIRNALAPGLAETGVELLNFLIESVSLPEEVEKAIDKRSAMGAVGNLNQYTQYQAATAIEKAAENEGGMGAAGIGMGMGAAMGQMMQQGAATPPPVPTSAAYFVAVDGKQTGPFELSALRGMLTPTTLVWTQGMANWQPAGEIAALASVIGGATPPPIPGF